MKALLFGNTQTLELALHKCFHRSISIFQLYDLYLLEKE